MITPDEVRGVPLFSAVDDEHIRRVAARAADVRLSPGDWAAREGEPGAFFCPARRMHRDHEVRRR